MFRGGSQFRLSRSSFRFVPVCVRVCVCACVRVCGLTLALSYGLRESDSPWLWARMRAYVQSMASIFHGVRIDNAHGTPIHVAAAMLDSAREARYVATGRASLPPAFPCTRSLASLLWSPCTVAGAVSLLALQAPAVCVRRAV